VEYLVLGRVCRRIWAIGMRDAFDAGPKAQLLKLHTQTSGRSLIAAEFKNNLTRTAIELLIAYLNSTNSCHSNSADEPFTTPTEEYVRLASHAQSILLEETGLFKHTMNLLAGSPGLLALERRIERAILEVFREIDGMGGVLAAMEQRYQRSKIQESAHRYEQQIYDGTRPIIGLNRYASTAPMPQVPLARTAPRRQRAQVEIQALQAKLQARNAATARAQALDSAVQQVRQGRLSGALAILAEAAKADPGNGQIQTLKLSLEDVIAIEKSYGRLEEVRMDARAAIEMGLTCDKDDKKMKSWLASVDEWKDRLAEGRHTARGAWLDQKFDGIKPAYDGMRSKAQETAQLYTSLAANFAGKSASAAKPKANIGGLVGGYGGGAFGGIGGSGDIGDNQKHAGVYKGSSDALARCAEEARRLSAE